MKKILIASAIGTALLYLLLNMPPQATSIAADSPTCSPANIEIKSMHARWVDNCRTRSCAYMQGAGELVNNCPTPIGVQLRVTGYDNKDLPIASSAAWPASDRNIPPGRYIFSLDHWLDPDPAIRRFDVRVESVTSWPS